MSVYGYTDDEFVAPSEPESVTLISRLDLSDPLHLHPNDSATLTIVSVKLKGTENYQIWYCAMMLALEGKNKTGFIDGSCRKSNVNEVFGRQWDRVNAIVLGWILNSISEDTLADYYHNLNALWKQFDALVQLHKCTCHAAEDFKRHNQLMKLMQFLMGLDNSYMQIRSSILSRDPLPDVRGAYAIISSEESHRFVSSSNSGTSQGSQSSVFNSAVDNFRAGIIVDSGANQHLTYTDKLLVNVIDISKLGIKVSHPNGTEAVITKVGNMILNKNLTLYDVLVVLEYCVSLMSVHKVAKDSGLIVAFNGNKAKQTREPFPLSEYKSSVLAELVHLDLWGPYKVTSKEGFRAEKRVLVGYASFKKGYKLFSLERKQFVYSRDVKFFEKVFPF
nr:ribonuclease H-like domain-containing protein [Tanacetum cinerariifolium]